MGFVKVLCLDSFILTGSRQCARLTSSETRQRTFSFFVLLKLSEQSEIDVHIPLLNSCLEIAIDHRR